MAQTKGKKFHGCSYRLVIFFSYCLCSWILTSFHLSINPVTMLFIFQLSDFWFTAALHLHESPIAFSNFPQYTTKQQQWWGFFSTIEQHLISSLLLVFISPHNLHQVIVPVLLIWFCCPVTCSGGERDKVTFSVFPHSLLFPFYSLSQTQKVE